MNTAIFENSFSNAPALSVSGSVAVSVAAVIIISIIIICVIIITPPGTV